MKQFIQILILNRTEHFKSRAMYGFLQCFDTVGGPTEGYWSLVQKMTSPNPKTIHNPKPNPNSNLTLTRP